MRELKQALQPFNGRSVCIRIEYKNRMFISGLSPSEVVSLKCNKPLLVLMLPEGRNFALSQILEALNRMIVYSENLIVDAGYNLHSADIKALPIGRMFLESLTD